MPAAIALPIASGAAAATVALGAWASLQQRRGGLPLPMPFRIPGHLRLPPLTGAEQEMTLQEMLADAWAGARIPVGFPEWSPPPQGDWAGILAAWLQQGSAAGQNLWNWLNRPRLPDQVNQLPGLGPNQTVTVIKSPRFVTYTIRMTGMRVTSGGTYPWSGYAQIWPTADPLPSGVGYTITGTAPSVRDDGIIYGEKTETFNVVVSARTADGRTGTILGFQQFKAGTGSVTIEPEDPNHNGWTQEANITPPAPRTDKLPQRTPAAVTAAPALPAAPAPALPAAPVVNEEMAAAIGAAAGSPIFTWNAGTSTGTGTVAVPVQTPQPNPFPAYLPAPSPAGTPVTEAGRLPQPITAAPPTTATDSHFINGVEIAGAAARASLAAVAAEVTRIERKLAQLMERPQDGQSPIDWIDKISDALDALQELLNAENATMAEQEWIVVSPCNKDSEGKPVQLAYKFAEAKYQAAILHRLNALLNATSHTVNWRQPACKLGNPNNVTIRAYGVEPMDLRETDDGTPTP